MHPKSLSNFWGAYQENTSTFILEPVNGVKFGSGFGSKLGSKNRKSSKIAVFALKLLNFISFLGMNDGL